MRGHANVLKNSNRVSKLKPHLQGYNQVISCRTAHHALRAPAARSAGRLGAEGSTLPKTQQSAHKTLLLKTSSRSTVQSDPSGSGARNAP